MGVHGVKAVFFDLDNTLVDTAAAGRRAIEEVRGGGRERERGERRCPDGLCCALQVVNALRSKHHCGEGEARGICDKVQAKLLKECRDPAKTCITDLRISHWEEAIQETIGGEANRSLAAECYFLWKATRLRHLTLAEDTRGMLTELRKAVRLLLLTNGDRQTQREKIEACACQPYFDAIVVGGEQKEEKPAPSIFHYCCDLLGVQPAECVMVGDSLDTDIQGGLNAGLRATVWLNKSMAAPADASPVPHYVISSVLDLPAVLQKIEHKVNAKLGTDRVVSGTEAR
ncbi:N-acylneuraminate-9-phosphatase isoform X1 [Numida meleagris]|uniref:N-acylneuraminate-9-phosphatase isoform X1 n=1 Tax=Numida meleagris TaxID=8996 RepID=UPI000B3D9FEB|nr:N-acylneuraminate-9-phosphatase isoform X1 [Numida meleagris]